MVVCSVGNLVNFKCRIQNYNLHTSKIELPFFGGMLDFVQPDVDVVSLILSLLWSGDIVILFASIHDVSFTSGMGKVVSGSDLCNEEVFTRTEYICFTSDDISVIGLRVSSLAHFSCF